jgi:uncharacterized protein (DUF305 family)
MKNHLRLGLLALAATLVLASCGNSGGGSQGNADGPQKAAGGMAGMDHDQMGHGPEGMGSKGMARQMVMENGKYSDERFIDAIVPHHQSAIEMALVAREKSKNPQIKELAENIISAQQTEIEQMKQWREQWYPED